MDSAISACGTVGLWSRAAQLLSATLFTGWHNENLYTKRYPVSPRSKTPLDLGSFPQEKITRKSSHDWEWNHFFCSLEWIIDLWKLVGNTTLATFCRKGFWKWNQEPRVRISEWRLDLVGLTPCNVKRWLLFACETGWLKVWNVVINLRFYSTLKPKTSIYQICICCRNDHTSIYVCIFLYRPTWTCTKHKNRIPTHIVRWNAPNIWDVWQEFAPTWWPSMPPSVQALDAGGWHCTSWHVPMWLRCQQVYKGTDGCCCCGVEGKELMQLDNCKNNLTLHFHCIWRWWSISVVCVGKRSDAFMFSLLLISHGRIEDLQDVG